MSNHTFHVINTSGYMFKIDVAPLILYEMAMSQCNTYKIPVMGHGSLFWSDGISDLG